LVKNSPPSPAPPESPPENEAAFKIEIKGDGKTLWRSKTLQAGNLAPYKVDLKGVNKIELLTHPTNDGSASDWALWLAPTLESK
jgi:hypothetical protein